MDHFQFHFNLCRLNPLHFVIKKILFHGSNPGVTCPRDGTGRERGLHGTGRDGSEEVTGRERTGVNEATGRELDPLPCAHR